MAAAFPGPYVDTGLTTRGPFTPQSLPAPVTNPADLGQDRSYTVDRAQVRGQDYASQDGNTPKPFPGQVSDAVEYDPYANGGGVSSYLNNSGS